jgi:hypothetical protein
LFTDTTEVRLRMPAEAQLGQFRTAMRAAGRSEQQIQDGIAQPPGLSNLTRLGVRDDISWRYGLDGRVDWRPFPGVTTVLQAGRSSNTNVDLTGLGASNQIDYQVNDYQARTSYGRFFAQGYMEQAAAGETYAVRSGEPVFDNSQATVMDLNLGYRLPWSRGTSVQLNATNVPDNQYQAFVGAPAIGRLVLLGLKHEFY